jgi:hypothetical protein
MFRGYPSLLACHFPIFKRRNFLIFIEAIMYLDIKQKNPWENMH